ncbi:MAG: DUF255 domain-containing protein [Flavobacteriaceae bacterium]|nr:DUF255 domain-containing protein [Flavobacteriaceae bacterium]
MKKFGLLSVLLLFSWLSFAQKTKVNWLSFEEAMVLNKKNPKKILVDVYTNWCYYCKVMDKKTYSNPKVANYINTHFYPVKFNAEQKEDLTISGVTYKYISNGRRGHNAFAVALLEGKLSYPTTVFFNDKKEIILRLPGYLDVKSYEPILVFLAEDFYETENWEAFVKEYKNTF